MDPSLPVEILSDEEDAEENEEQQRDSKKRKRIRDVEEERTPFIILDSTPLKQNSPFLVPETPLSDFSGGVSLVKCSTGHCSNSITRLSADKFSGITGMICLDSDNESEGSARREISMEIRTTSAVFDVEENFELEDGFTGSAISLGKSSEKEVIVPSCSTELGISRDVDEENIQSFTETPAISKNKISTGHTKPMLFNDCDDAAASEDNLNMNFNLRESIGPLEPIISHFGEIKDNSLPGVTDFIQFVEDSPIRSIHFPEDVEIIPQLDREHEVEKKVLKQPFNVEAQKYVNLEVNAEKKNHSNDEAPRKKQSKEEKARLNEERKLRRETEKLRKQALKAEAAEMKKLQKEKQKWEKGKLAIKSIVAEVDAKVVETGSIGGHLLGRFAEKGLGFRITSNPIQRSILWNMNVPEQISQFSAEASEVSYIVFVYEAEEFCTLLTNENQSLIDHVHQVQRRYPSYTICYTTNKLMSYINKREQGRYKNPSNITCWRRPPVEEALSRLTTHFSRVHSRQCLDEAEVAEHLVGLTCSLASCQFRKKLTRLSISANGSLVPKDFIDKSLIKKNMWLKVLIAIPKVQPRHAMAIWKRYPNMRSLLNAYLDPNKSVHDKEFLLKDLTIEGPLGNENRRLGEVCSKRIYRILMAQSGGIVTDDVEDGADLF